MKNLVRLAVIGVSVVAVLAVVFVLISTSEHDSASTGRVVFASGEPTDVEYVFVRNGSGEFRFYFDFDEDGYVLDDIPPYITDIEAFYDFMANSARISAVRHIAADDT